MKKIIKILLTSILFFMLLAGCSTSEGKSTGSDEFVEVLTKDNHSLGTISKTKEVKNFVKKVDYKAWKKSEIKEDIEKNGKFLCEYRFYQTVDSAFLKKNEKPYMSISNSDLYKLDSNYYIFEKEDGTTNLLPQKVGKFLEAPKKLEIDTSVSAKEVLKKLNLKARYVSH